MELLKPYIGIDASGSLSDPNRPLTVLSAYSSDDCTDMWKTELPRRKCSPQQNRSALPTETFHYLVIKPEHLNRARRIYGRERELTKAEVSWNGSFFEYRTLIDAHLKLLEAAGFDPKSHAVIIDGLGRPALMRDELAGSISSQTETDVPRKSLLCETNADNQYWAVRNAHNNSLRILDRIIFSDEYKSEELNGIAQRAVEFDASDMMRYELARLGRHERREMRRWAETHPNVLGPMSIPVIN